MNGSPPFKVVPSPQGNVLSLDGDVYTILISSDESGGAYTLIEGRVAPHGGPPPHVHHREDEAFYVIEGELEFTCNGRITRASAGDFIHLPRESLHFFKNTAARPARLLIHCIPGGLDRFFEEAGQRLPNRNSPAAPVTEADLKKLFETAPKYGLEIKVPS